MTTEHDKLVEDCKRAILALKSTHEEDQANAVIAIAVEKCARLVESGWRCITCEEVFLAEDGHECESPNWDGMTPAQLAAAIRALLSPNDRGD